MSTVARSDYVRLRLRPITQVEARQYITEVHRHNDPPSPAVMKASVGIVDDTGALRGVGILGRPTSNGLEDGTTAEIRRVATDGVRNGASMLYGALVRVAWSLGYDRIFTYTLESEPGTSLRAAGWRVDGISKTHAWTHASRQRSDTKLTMFYDVKMPMEGDKVRWIIERNRQKEEAK